MGHIYINLMIVLAMLFAGSIPVAYGQYRAAGFHPKPSFELPSTSSGRNIIRQPAKLLNRPFASNIHQLELQPISHSTVIVNSPLQIFGFSGNKAIPIFTIIKPPESYLTVPQFEPVVPFRPKIQIGATFNIPLPPINYLAVPYPQRLNDFRPRHLQSHQLINGGSLALPYIERSIEFRKLNNPSKLTRSLSPNILDTIRKGERQHLQQRYTSINIFHK